MSSSLPRISGSRDSVSCSWSCTIWIRVAISSSRCWRRTIAAVLHAAGRQSRRHARREAFDLAGRPRDHAIDALAAALAMPLATEPHLVTFAPEGPWRGETHRAVRSARQPGPRCSRRSRPPGAEQVILVTALPPQGRPHELGAERGDLRGHAAELAGRVRNRRRCAMRSSSGSGRFRGFFVIRPPHNPLGPLDFAGVYDERSDRVQTLAELVDRGYEDAYRQFIEPVVAASGDRLEAVQR